MKSDASKDWVPVDDFVLEEVSARVATFGTGPEEVLMTSRCRRVVQRSSFGTCWRESVTKAGLPKGTRFHGATRL